MKKRIMLSGILFIIIIISVLVYFNKNNNDLENVLQNKKYNETISMMLETASGSGEYEKTTASGWPTDGYIFNAELSKCENGGELSWDAENNKVLMSGNTSDKCYVYFDKVNIITFTINGTEYNAIEGMTWGKWVNSEYNIEKKYGLECEKINGNVIFKLNNGGYYVSETSIGILLNGTDIIIANGNYANTGMAEKINC
ncbi:unknown [Firmicutes bacterium CAG:460]|nr:unknown [Firmicutes bacterium CAG:460]